MSLIKLKPSIEADIHHFFEYQLDKDALYMAAFTSKDPTDKVAYVEKYTKLLYNPTVNMQTILLDDKIIGTVTKFDIHNDAHIAFWLDKPFWGRGITSKALEMFLKIEQKRPIYGHTAFDNFGSQRVFEKCGFLKIGIDKGFANARNTEIEEFIFKLN